MSSSRLTGRQRHRITWLGRLVLQVEYEYRYMPAGMRPAPVRFQTSQGWRDAVEGDLDVLEALAARPPIPTTGSGVTPPPMPRKI